MTRLALVMIVRDEARCLARCLASARPHVDRMIVLDTGSSDGTIGIARAAGAEVHDFAWCDDFAAARNAALDYSDADWNLVLDADEWLEAGVEALSPEAFPPHARRTPAFIGCVRIANRQDANKGGGRRAYIPRLLPRGVRYEGRIHEQPVSALPLVQLPLVVGHDGYEAAQQARKKGRNAALLRAEIAAQPDDAYLRYQLGREYLVDDRAAEAAECLVAAYHAVQPDAAYRHGIVLYALRALRGAGRFDEALALADAEQSRWPHSPDFYYAVAELYLDWAGLNPEIARDQLLPVVEMAWLKCLQIGERPDLAGSVEGLGSIRPAESLAHLYRSLGLIEEADQYDRIAADLRAAKA
ncbi:glycosyltransferase [Allosphingosinicella deserti]|uniref:Family 2 glycosyl transferase n=1 Tax=Allosphingosinicella deserti TaxID=2116704 RepID=A0A2P7QVJ5_9SPHN|nr:glycosyltransferase family 2 protein [Sphingomonas deserti]PSJ41964.1 family 2 glycosyl transferase [Sphingomonas deserti]